MEPNSLEAFVWFKEQCRRCLYEQDREQLVKIARCLQRWSRVHPYLIMSDACITQMRQDLEYEPLALFVSRVTMLCQIVITKYAYESHLKAIIEAMSTYDHTRTLKIGNEPITGMHAMIERAAKENLGESAISISQERATDLLFSIVKANRFMQFALLQSFSTVASDLNAILDAAPAD